MLTLCLLTFYICISDFSLNNHRFVFNKHITNQLMYLCTQSEGLLPTDKLIEFSKPINTILIVTVFEFCSTKTAPISVKQFQIDSNYEFIRMLFKTESKCCNFSMINGWWTYTMETSHISKVLCYLLLFLFIWFYVRLSKQTVQFEYYERNHNTA